MAANGETHRQVVCAGRGRGLRIRRIIGAAILFPGLALTAGADLELPFDFLHNQIVLQVTIHRTGPYNFVLDTGTHSSTIDLGAIEAAYVRSGYGNDEDLQRRGGNLGNGALQDFVLTLDYRDGVVVLESADE